MYLVIVVVVYFIFAKVFVDWKRWKEFYPTIQYFIICNLAYNFIFYNQTLWAYKAVTVQWLNHTIIELVFTFFIIPVVIMIYLQYFPKGKKGIIYIVVWIAYFSIIEYLFYKRGLFLYDNDWGLIWSSIFNTIMFIILRLHYKNPLAAMLCSIPIIAILLFIFHPMLHDLK
ncbi:MAG: CBO0543 family protein [Bacillus sp. (in: firmicutes)]